MDNGGGVGVRVVSGGSAASAAASTPSKRNRHQMFSTLTVTDEQKVVKSQEKEVMQDVNGAVQAKKGAPLKVLFLSADTGGGHRASAESLANQFLRHFPGTKYDLLDIWTEDGVLPYRTLVNSYKHLSAHPRQWRFLYHLSNTRPYELVMDFHSTLMCEHRIRRRIASYDPDVVISVHPTMNNVPIISLKKISKKLGKHIPFFTVVTDFGSGHSTWFHNQVEKMYIASERIRKLAKRRGRTPDEKLVMSGLPIRHDFAVHAEKLGDRTTVEGKQYQRQVRKDLQLNPDKRMVLVMGGGEGVGSLSSIVKELYAKFVKQGVDATICVVCGRNEKLKNELETFDWDSVLKISHKPKKRRYLFRLLPHAVRSRRIQEAIDRAAAKEAEEGPDFHHTPGKVDVVGLGFVTRMAEYMVAADVLVSKAGPGTIAEAAAVGLPIMLTSYLPGQEAGNVDVVLDGGFGDFCEEPEEIASEVACWLQDAPLLDIMSNGAMEVGHPHAASDIVLDIGEITHGWLQKNKKGTAFVS